MRYLGRLATGVLAGVVMAFGAAADELGNLKMGVLKFGTVNWELDVIKHHGLDKKEGFELEIVGFGGGQATNVALMGDGVNGIVDDWLWVSRQRSEGIDLVFIPYSSTVGAVMVMPDSGIGTLADLKGRTIGIAGGPLDKSWLLVQGLARQNYGIDLAAEVEPAFGAPPLLAEKFRQGELDAVLNYWHYCARLEAGGALRLVEVSEAAAQLGVAIQVPQLGYVFKQEWADANAPLVEAFSRASRAAKEILDESDAEWERLRERTNAADDATLATLKLRFREGIVRKWGDEERAAAADLYDVLAGLGGERLVGGSKTLADGTFWPNVAY